MEPAGANAVDARALPDLAAGSNLHFRFSFRQSFMGRTGIFD
jgi:hypothetical protein